MHAPRRPAEPGWPPVRRGTRDHRALAHVLADAQPGAGTPIVMEETLETSQDRHDALVIADLLRIDLSLAATRNRKPRRDQIALAEAVMRRHGIKKQYVAGLADAARECDARVLLFAVVANSDFPAGRVAWPVGGDDDARLGGDNAALLS